MDEGGETGEKEQLAQLTAGIVAAYVGNHVVPIDDLTGLIAEVHSALARAHGPAAAEPAIVERAKPAVPIKKSVEPDCIICLEDGLKFRSLKRHLMTFHNMSPDEYRRKWELPESYPMVAPDYAERRSQLARDMGLGTRRKKKAK
ncbi:MAG: MucR family transcriptional regulator [Alphaproteobacteria bacterium]|nr:MucR family transcriptional regulator [Alphaproteobacteria bacterium]MBU1552284.1 MucR family transcriptional regulator [Alphaproteobacteria bacterium]MBU2336808.1 MucR family transcriptional regulator [Alphaproteobacteria bacterium]MBU2389564.1 MucR family transcriptional regulator [Alphaproteobacteria bacterium]